MKVSLVGTGCGSMYTMTAGAVKAIREAGLIIGASRLLESLPEEWGGQRIAAISPEEILNRIMEYEEAHTGEEDVDPVCIVFSGDAGFYSGAKQLLPLLEENGIDGEVLPGISSLQMLSARLKKPWQDWKLVSAHGVDCDAVRSLAVDRSTFFLTGGDLGPAEICAQLVRGGKGDAEVYIAERLSYDDENIYMGRASEFTGADFDSLSVILVGPTGGEVARDTLSAGHVNAEDELIPKEAIDAPGTIENDDAPGSMEGMGAPGSTGDMDTLGSTENTEAPERAEEANDKAGFRAGLPDYLFIRGDVPMTKRDVRAVIAGHMQIMEDDVIWDVGAGTGSVTCEMAIQTPKGMVYGVEKDYDGVTLIGQNAERFGLRNIDVIYGEAPDALVDLPAPDRVFIGGSDGNMARIIDVALEKNPMVFICVTAILLETATETMAAMEARGMNTEITQITVSTGRGASGKHMMIGGNPIFIITGSLR